MALLHDEMSIKSDLVFDSRSGKAVGFVRSKKDGGEDELATHVLVFYVVGITSQISLSLGFFPTAGVSAMQMFAIFWQAVGFLENNCGLKVGYYF